MSKDRRSKTLKGSLDTSERAFMSKFVLLAFTLAIAGIGNANAQTPAQAPAAPSKTYVLIPYDQPDGEDRACECRHERPQQRS